MQKHLMVAGCSFSATTTQRDGTSWSERLADKLGWRLTNLARQGCSNGGIRIQIEEIRRQRPDFAIVTPTFWDRMEIPAAAAPYDWSIPPGGWNPPLQQHLQNREIKNGYDRKDGIDNVNYGNNNYNMICETIFTLAENFSHPYRSGRIDVQTQKAVRQYINAIYDNQWKKQMDEWIITEGVLQLFHDGIAFLFQPVLLWPFDVDNKEEWKHIMPKVIPAHYVMSDVNQSVLGVCGQNPFVGDEIEDDPGYHSNATGQQIIADNWYNRITQDHGLQ
jgi:hypothetical protein